MVFRRRGLDGGMLRACALALLLGLSLAQPAPQNPPCGGSAANNLTQPDYLDTVSSSPLGSISPFVNSFLGTVQPNAFPYELIIKLINDMTNPENIREALVYEIGFLVCVAIGVVYIVLMPLVGILLACCRCCGNCGGKMQQKQKSSTSCRRNALYWGTFVTTVIILAGNIIMFKGNNDFRHSVNQTPKELDNNLENVDTFLAAVPQQLNQVVNESSRTVTEVEKNLDDIGNQLGVPIQNRVNDTLNKAVDSVRLMDQETGNTDGQLNTLKTLLNDLQTDVNKLKTNVTGVKDRVSATINNADCENCDLLRPLLQDLTLDSLTVSTSSLNDIQASVDKIKTLNLTSKIAEVDNFYNGIPARVSQETVDVVASSKTFLNDIKTQISSVTDEIPLAALSSVSERIEQMQSEINRLTPQILHQDSIRWRVSLTVCCLVLLVVVCNVLGLLLGPIGLKAHEDPTKRSCTADCGGTFFMMSAGFSFVFSWLFMIIVVPLFVVGGGFYTLGCKPWDTGELLKFVDTQYELGPLLGLDTNITYSGVYGDCLDNKTVWTTFHLNQTINLDDLLNVSKYTGEIQGIFDKADITLEAITILTPADKSQLTEFSDTAAALDMSAITTEMENIYKVNLNATADKLDEAATAQTNVIKKEFQDEATDLRNIQSSVETTIYPLMRNINSTMQSLKSSVGKITTTVGDVLTNVEAAQAFILTNTTQIIKAESQKLLDCQLGYFTVYADWAKETITEELGRCGQVAKTVLSLETILCSQLVDSMNTFWFGLGWCLVFFIPSIILSIKLAKFYRKMKYTDIYE